MRHKNWLLITMLGIISLLNSGCAAVLLGGGAAAAGAGTILYIKGELQSTEGVSLDTAWMATQTAIKDMEFITGTTEKDAFSAKLIAYTSDNRKIQINLKRKTDKLTEIAIRVGTFGDESLSLLILENIKERY
ncbi:MAG: DUF3568 family protein [Deltaproteobacteria bacterium]|nr:DUF3568 family protein [Deltaproteobacteria bacterium]